jgi:hypothetical protein
MSLPKKRNTPNKWRRQVHPTASRRLRGHPILNTNLICTEPEVPLFDKA